MTHDIIWLDEADSTNNEAKRQIKDLSDMSVIAAVRQTAGRGQRNNTWLSQPGMNLTFSIVLKYGEGSVSSISPADQVLISDATASSIIDFLSKHRIEARVKLPNDIYVGDRKICGILIEHTLCGQALIHTIVGVGLNVNQTVFDADLPNPTSMALETGSSSYDLHALLEELLAVFDLRLGSLIL